MSMALAYWIIMLLWLAFGLWRSWPNYHLIGLDLMVFALFVLVGWRVFGPPIHA